MPVIATLQSEANGKPRFLPYAPKKNNLQLRV